MPKLDFTNNTVQADDAAVAMARACNSASLTTRGLQAALKTASAVEAMLLLPLIERAATLSRDIDSLLGAMQQDRA